MALDLTAMTTAVRTRLGNPSTDGFFTDAQIMDLINEALAAINSEHDWPWVAATETLPTVAGTATLTPGTGWQRTKGLIIDGFDAMILLPLQQLREMQTATRSQPLYYAIDDEVILLRPVPDAVYSVVHDFYKLEPELTTGSNEPLMPRQFRYSIIEFATYLAHLRQGDMGRAQAALVGYQGWLGRMRDHKRRFSAPMRVRVRPGSWL